MIETEQSVLIAAPIESVWRFARDIRGWAGLMPGMQDCQVLDEDNSHWTLKVGVGGLVRTVRVQVHVEEWDGPQRVRFAYKLEGDPVQGGGSYLATPKGPGETEVALQVRVEGSGPMAPMWEAMGRPVLPQLAKAFAGQLKAEIEKAAAAAPAPPPTPTTPTPTPTTPARTSLGDWLRNLWRAVFSRRAPQTGRN